MTFTEAAIEVLRREGKPLHFKKLTEIAIRENLLDHVGKIPEEIMADQLAAHCRLPRIERRIVPVQHGTFALVEWGLEEDPAGIENLIEPPPEDELPYRGRERHPIPSREGRAAGREGRARRREEEERRCRRFPPPAEVAYEILAGAGKPLSLPEIAVVGAERLLMPDAFVRDGASLRAALLEDNRRRESAGRKPLFHLDGDTVSLVAQPETGERPAAPVPARAPASAQEARRAALAALRRRLRECDEPTVEHVAGRLLERMGFRDIKVAKRGREHVVCTAKRRMGIADVRHAIRIVRSGADAGRRDVADLRRDLGHYGAQVGIVITSGEAAREARGEAAAAGQLPVVLLCGEALAEAFADAGVGCVPVIVPEVDDSFFATAAEAAEREESLRRARREERERREEARRAGAAARAEEPVEAADEEQPTEPAHGVPVEVEAERPEEIEGEEEGEEGEGEGEEEPAEAAGGGEGAAAAEPGPGTERRRRRRRRRRRGGRGRGREAASEGTSPLPGEPAAGAPTDAAPAPDVPGAESPQPAAERRAPPGAPSPAPPPHSDGPAGEG